MSRPLHPDVLLGIHLSAICSRHRYDRNTVPVIAELLEMAGDRVDILAMEAGRWAGYYDDEHSAALVAAIVTEIPGAAAWTADGARRRAAPAHGTTGFGSLGGAFTPQRADAPGRASCRGQA
ncbi:hypothetical protein LPW41_11610 [Microbacterium sp. JC 701]|uniref:hypothetical protein n=1 Tax=Microbacterium sp. JC 701 TaxID=2897389 RepID=UPI001E5BEF72|nr:hypothetical protein [Microbacterium sp. JC 701]MCD2170343.1 hypothetical protein [Microbacterium sp. JC 701]